MIDIILFHLNQPWIRFIKTIYLNFKLLPWNIAVKLPHISIWSSKPLLAKRKNRNKK